MKQVDYYIHDQPEERQKVLHSLRALILAASPQIEERFSYNIPFYYYRNKPFVYSGVIKDYPEKIVLGLFQGHLYSNNQGLITGNKKIVRHVILDPLSPFPQKALQEIIHEGIIILQQKIEQ